MPRPKKFYQLSHKDLRQINLLVSQGKYQRAAGILKRARPVIELLADLRQMSSAQAAAANQAGNWQAVLLHLQAYHDLAKQFRAVCLAEAGQEPPAHTPADQALLDRARQQV